MGCLWRGSWVVYCIIAHRQQRPKPNGGSFPPLQGSLPVFRDIYIYSYITHRSIRIPVHVHTFPDHSIPLLRHKGSIHQPTAHRLVTRPATSRTYLFCSIQFTWILRPSTIHNPQVSPSFHLPDPWPSEASFLPCASPVVCQTALGFFLIRWRLLCPSSSSPLSAFGPAILTAVGRVHTPSTPSAPQKNLAQSRKHLRHAPTAHSFRSSCPCFVSS